MRRESTILYQCFVLSNVVRNRHWLTKIIIAEINIAQTLVNPELIAIAPLRAKPAR